MTSFMRQPSSRKQRSRKKFAYEFVKITKLEKNLLRGRTSEVFKSVLWTGQLTGQESGVAYKCCIYFLLKDF